MRACNVKLFWELANIYDVPTAASAIQKYCSYKRGALKEMLLDLMTSGYISEAEYKACEHLFADEGL